MSETTRLCYCGAKMTSGPGQLDQSGKTHLPTTLWTCPTCGLNHWEPARGAAWQTTEVRDALTKKVISTPRNPA